MKNHLLPLFFALVSLPCLAAVTVESNEESIGDVFQYHVFKKTFRVINDGDAAVEIEAIDPTSRFGRVVNFPHTLGPGEKADIDVEADTLDSSGVFICGFIARLKDGGKVPFTVRGFTMSAYEELNPRIEFGTVKAGNVEPKSLVLHTHEQAAVSIAKVAEKPGFVDVEIAGDTAKFRLSPNAQWGHNVGLVKLVTDVSAQKDIWVQVRADINGAVVASPAAADMGAVYQGAHGSGWRVQLDQLDGKPFRLGAIKVDGNKRLDVKQAGCLPEGKPACHAILISVDESEEPGLIRSTIAIELPDSRKTLMVPVTGFLFRAGTVIHNLDQKPGADGESSSAVAAAPIADELKKATRSDTQGMLEAPVPEGSGPLLKWQMNHDALIYGYVVCRSDSEDGPLLRISKVVRTLSEDGQPATYRWRDTGAVAGQKYYYAIYALYRDGHWQQLTGALPKVAGQG